MNYVFLKYLYNRLYDLEHGIEQVKQRIELYKEVTDIVRADVLIDQKIFLQDTIKHYLELHK